MDVYLCSVFSLCLKLLWLLIVQLQLWQLYAPEDHSSIFLWANQYWVSKMWFWHHNWFWRYTMRGSVGSTTILQSHNLIPRCLLRHMPTMAWFLHRWVFSFRVEPPTSLYVICWCLLWCLLSDFRFLCGCPIYQWGSTIGIFNTTALLSIPVAGICASWWLSLAHIRNALSGCPPTALSKEELHATYSAVPQPFHQYGKAYSFGDLAKSHPIPQSSLHCGEGSSFPGSVPHDDKVNYESAVSH